MLPSNTICVSQEGPANALALNKDCTQVVIAGRNVFKVFSIGDNEFSEVCNLRVGKNLSLNFSSIDVAWSTIEENTLATAATNGAVVVWNLGRSGRSKQEHVFSDHKRTVNKVSFHLTEPALLISGSQDGMMKCFDLRMKEVARTFISNTESIRDVQFSPHQAHTFAAVSENGSVQLWDVRRHERCLAQFTAHSGPVFACDWHPDLPALATASRDKTIKVWDIHAKPTLEHTIYTIASVGHVKWRPQKRYQVASCALVLDCAVHVWDVRRPHVPLATFAEHRDVTTAIAWQASPHVFLSTSRDCTLYRHRFQQAAHPVLWANPHAVGVSARGELAHARPARPLPALAARAALPAGVGGARKQPAAGSLTPAAQAALERAFPGGAGSLLARLPGAAGAAVPPAAYRVRGGAPHELAAHNAAVARALRRPLAAHVWEVVRLETAARAARARGTPAPPPPPPPRPAPAPATPPDPHEEEADAEAADEWADTFHNSGVLGMPTLSIYIPVARAARPADGGWVSAASAHYVDVDAADWALPEEAFPLRAAPPPPPPLHQPPHPAQHPPPPPPDNNHDRDNTVRKSGGSGAGGTSPGGSSSPGSGLSSAPLDQANPLQSEEGGEAELLVRGEGAREAWDAAGGVAAALRLHADLGDVQLAACVMLVLQEYRSDLFPYIDEGLQEHWLLGYIEFLQRHKMYNAATEVVLGAWLGSVWGVSQQSTSAAVCCARCGRRARRAAAACGCGGGAAPAGEPCAVCRRAVRGLYAWCQGCAHGGHAAHLRAWFAAHRTCPAGCGHRCTPPSSLPLPHPHPLPAAAAAHTL